MHFLRTSNNKILRNIMRKLLSSLALAIPLVKHNKLLFFFNYFSLLCALPLGVQIMQKQYNSGACHRERQWAKSHCCHHHSTGRVPFCWGLCVTVRTDTLSLFYKLGPSEQMLIYSNKVQYLIMTIGFLFFQALLCGIREVW